MSGTGIIAVLSGQPTGKVNDSIADITVGGTNVVAHKYKLDAGAWNAETPVSTHIILSGLSNGMHTVSVIGKDAAGNWQPEASATTTSWTVAVLPTAVLSGQPTGKVNDNIADITVGGTNVVAYKYKLDVGNWSAETPVSTHITLSSLADGLHTVSVIGKDAAGNWQPQTSPTAARWTVDINLMGPIGKTILGICFAILGALLVYMVYTIWPTAKPDASGNIPDSLVSFFGYHFTVTADVRLILLVAIVAALGSYIHAATSFADFAGSRRLVRSWLWWYILRFFIGASLALIFYFVIRGGFLSVSGSTADLNSYGIAAVAGLVGMFSKQATDKLAELFDTLFKTKEERGDKLSNPKPEITKLDPTSVKPGAENVSLNVFGNDFVEESVVRFNSKDRTTKYVSATQLTVAVPKEDVASTGKIIVTVFSPSPGGGTSKPEEWPITDKG